MLSARIVEGLPRQVADEPEPIGIGFTFVTLFAPISFLILSFDFRRFPEVVWIWGFEDRH